MRNSPNTETEEVKQKSIVDYLAEKGYTPIRQGRETVFFSPFRQEKCPSFFVNEEKNLWYDFGTGEGGDIISLVQKVEGVSFLEALKRLADNHSITIVKPAPTKTQPKVPYPKAQETVTFYRAISRTSNDTFVARYFKNKGLNFHPTMGAVEFRDLSGQRYIAIPCPSKDRIFGLECRGVTDDCQDALHSDGRKIRRTIGHKLPWVFKISEKNTGIVTESIIDALSAEVLFGFDGCLIALNGVGNVHHLQKIAVRLNKILLALDNDQPGRDAQEKAVSVLKGTAEVKIIRDHIEAGVKGLYELLELRLRGKNKNDKEVAS